MIYGLNDLSYGVGDIYQADIRRHDNLSSIARFHTNHWKRRHIREFSQNGRLDKYHWKHGTFTVRARFNSLWLGILMENHLSEWLKICLWSQIPDGGLVMQSLVNDD